jgi:hypothetical protein
MFSLFALKRGARDTEEQRRGQYGVIAPKARVSLVNPAVFHHARFEAAIDAIRKIDARVAIRE